MTCRKNPKGASLTKLLMVVCYTALLLC